MSAWDNIKPFVSKFAPIVGAALGGPLGGAAGSILASALGVKDADPKNIEQAIKNGTLTGEQIVALKQAEDQFALQMKQLDINSVEDMEKLAIQDRDSARNREIKTGDSWTPRILAGVIVFGFLWSVWFVLSGRVQGLKDPAVVGMIGTLIGYISAKTDTVVGYYFGSSAGSDKKTDLMGRK